MWWNYSTIPKRQRFHHTLQCMWLFIHAEIKLSHVSKRAPRNMLIYRMIFYFTIMLTIDVKDYKYSVFIPS